MPGLVLVALLTSALPVGLTSHAALLPSPSTVYVGQPRTAVLYTRECRYIPNPASATGTTAVCYPVPVGG